MTQRWRLALLGLLLTTLVATVAEPAIQNMLAKIFPTAGQPIEISSTPIVSGTGTADTVRVYRGALTGLTKESTAVLTSGLDTTKVYLVTLGIKVGGGAGEARYAINFSTTAPSMDTAMCTYCNYYYGNPTGASSDSGLFAVAYYATGATGSIELENRLGVTVPQMMWEIQAGGP